MKGGVFMRSKGHMDYEDLLLLYKYISLGYSSKKVSQLTGKNRSTIYRLILTNSEDDTSKVFSPHFGNYKHCTHLMDCKRDGIKHCPDPCPTFKLWICPRLRKFPYICNFCEQRYTCKKPKRLFNPEEAYIFRNNRLKESKSIPNVSKNELKKFDEFVSPLIRQGLSIESIYSNLKDEFPVSTRTVRHWINKSYLAARRVDLINAQKREYSPAYKYKRVSKDPLLKVGRTYSSYVKYMETHDYKDVLQFDTVHGKKTDKKCILTIHHPYSKFQIGILLDNFTPDEVINKIREIEYKVGEDDFHKYFRILLCDNGLEFDKMHTLEVDEETGEVYARVFYTRPYRSGDKGSCERNHELFRYVVAKGKSLDDITQEELNFIFSNINSYPRKSLSYRCPIDVMIELMGVNFVSKLGIYKVPFKQLTFKKKLK